MFFDIKFSKKVFFRIWFSMNTNSKLINTFFPVTKMYLQFTSLFYIEKFAKISICNIEETFCVTSLFAPFFRNVGVN